MVKKKLIICSSYGGGGHVSVDQALQHYLEQHYDIKTVYPLTTWLAPLDPIHFFSLGFLNGEKLYSYLLRKKWTALLNYIYRCAQGALWLQKTIIRNIIQDNLRKESADLVISVMPLINEPLAKACKKISIPFLLIPTDLDCTSFLFGVQPDIAQSIHMALAFDIPEIHAYTDPYDIPPHQIHETGFILKPSFFTFKDLAAIHQEFSIKPNKPVIMLLMGAAGSKALYDYAQQLVRLPFPVHILFCLGRHESLQESIAALSCAPQVTTSYIGFTNKIADLLTVSDICISKAGTVSVCEALFMHVPLILDATTTPLLWEDFNLTFVQKYQFGTLVHNYKDINDILTTMLPKKEVYKENMKKFVQKPANKYILPLVEQLLQQQSS